MHTFVVSHFVILDFADEKHGVPIGQRVISILWHQKTIKNHFFFHSASMNNNGVRLNNIQTRQRSNYINLIPLLLGARQDKNLKKNPLYCHPNLCIIVKDLVLILQVD